jgi:hypothetical protein
VADLVFGSELPAVDAKATRRPRRLLSGLDTRDELVCASDVVAADENLARTAVADGVACACAQVREAVIAGDALRPQEATDRLCFQRVAREH